MSDDYVSRVTLTVNGQNIEDFKSFTDNEQELAKEVSLMNKTGYVGVKEKFGCKVEYVIPQTGEFDFKSVKDGTVTVEFEGGKRITFRKVRTLKIGEAKVDGEKETIREITFGALGRVEE